MEISLDISALISALFWPAAVFAIVFILREPLTYFIKRVAHAKGFGFQALGVEATVEFDQGLDEAQQLAEEAGIAPPQNGTPQSQKENETTPQGLPTNEFEPLYDVAEHDPRSAILAAWAIVQREIRRLVLKNVGGGATVSSNKRMLKALENSETIPQSIVSMASELYQLRSKAVYYPKDIVPQERAIKRLV